MGSIRLNKPLIITLYGFPGAGKSHFARQLCASLGLVHIHDDRIRFELFNTARYSKEENEIVAHIMDYMSEEFLHAGTGVVYDADTSRRSQRKDVGTLATKARAET